MDCVGVNNTFIRTVSKRLPELKKWLTRLYVRSGYTYTGYLDSICISVSNISGKYKTLSHTHYSSESPFFARVCLINRARYKNHFSKLDSGDKPNHSASLMLLRYISL